MSHHVLPDNVSGAGLDFSYEVWTPNTQLKLSNVPWDSEYRDVVGFDSKTDYLDYINSLPGGTTELRGLTYAKQGSPVRLPLPHSYVSQFNYITVHNPAMSHVEHDTDSYFSYFIVGVEFVAPQTTVVYLQLDVWNTYIYDVEFNDAFVERGHIGVANELATLPGGDSAYLTVREGHDIGDQHRVNTISEVDLTGEWSESNQPAVVIVSTLELDKSGVDNEGNPKIVSAWGHTANGIPQGANAYYVKSSADFVELMDYLSSYPWVSQSIISASLVPGLPAESISGPTFTVGIVEVQKIVSYPRVRDTVAIESWRERILNTLPGEYRHLTKFATYPYAFFELTMFNGKPLVLKPEKIGRDNLNLRVQQMITPPSPRLTVHVPEYNAAGGVALEGGESHDMATGMLDFPQVSIVNDGYLAYMASNRNSIAYQHQASDWSQQKAMAAAQVGYDQMNSNISTASELDAINRRARNDSTRLQNQHSFDSALTGMGTNMVTGGGAGALVGGPVGAGAGIAGGAIAGVSGLVNQSMSASHALKQNQVANWAARATTRVGNESTAWTRDANHELATFSAKGDYETTIAGINAKIQDSEMIPPTVSGQVGGDAFHMMLNNGIKVWVRLRTLGTQAMHDVAAHWLRYGYAVNQRISLRKTGGRNPLHCMERFTYWRTKETYVKSSKCPETFKQTIRGIMEKGVTVWRNPDDVGIIFGESNMPIPGVRLPAKIGY